MKRLLILLLIVLILCSACQKKKDYADDLPCAELMDSVEEQLPINLGYETYGAEYVRAYFEDTDLPDDVCLRYTALSEDIGEFGVFHVDSKEDAEALRSITESYLQALRDEKSTFIASYAPKELAKLEHAEVRVFGNYVTYAILSDTDRKLFFDTVEKMLSKE